MGTAVPLLTARVWVLCGGDGTVSTGTGLLSAGVQSARVWVMCGGSGPRASTTVVLSASTGSTIFSEDHVVTP